MAKAKETKKKFDNIWTSILTNSDSNTNENSLKKHGTESSEWSDAIRWAKTLNEEFNEKNEISLVEPTNKESEKKYRLINRDFDDKKFKDALFQLVNSEIKNRLIIENVNDLIFILNKYFKFDFVNKNINQKLLGYRNEELIGEYMDIFIHHDDIKKAIELVSEIWKKKGAISEIRFKRKDGTYVWLELKGKVFIDIDGEEKILLIGRDITERKHNDSKIRAIQEKIWQIFKP